MASNRLAPEPPPTAAIAVGPKPKEQGLLTIRKEVREVRLLFTVTDEHNRPVRDLKREQVTVLDRAKPVQITSFTRDTGLPLHLGILLDNSASVEKQFVAEQQAAGQFLRRVLRPDSDRAFVVSFNMHSSLRQDETGNMQELTSAIESTRPDSGMTAIYDAIVDACSKRLSADDRLTRRAIVLLSDGEDNFSIHSIVDAAEAAQRAEIALYTISIHPGRSKTAGDMVMERLAGATGGLAFVVSKPEQFAEAFTAIEEQLRSQYAVTYKPAGPPSDSGFSRVRVNVNDPRQFTVHARAGYWEPRR